MQWDVEHMLVLVKNLLSWVAVVNILMRKDKIYWMNLKERDTFWTTTTTTATTKKEGKLTRYTSYFKVIQFFSFKPQIISDRIVWEVFFSTVTMNFSHRWNPHPIDDQYLVQLELCAELFGSYGDGIEEAETHGLRGLGVVTRWPYDRQTVLQFPGSDFKGKLDYSTGSLEDDERKGRRQVSWV